MEKSQANIFVAHSQDDSIVPIEYGYDIYYSAYADNKRFKFSKYADKGHSYMLYSYEAANYIIESEKARRSYFDGKNPSEEEINDYYKNNFDRKILCNALDKELMETVVEFFNANN